MMFSAPAVHHSKSQAQMSRPNMNSASRERYACFERGTEVKGATRTMLRVEELDGAAEEAPRAYRDVELVAEAAEQAGLARRVAFLRPKVCVKG